MTSRASRRGIGKLSKRTGCHIETIRYCERIGLMPRPVKSDGGHRRYQETHVDRLDFIRRTRELGFTLEQVRTLLTLVDGGRYGCARVKPVALQHLQEVRRKVAELRRIEQVLAGMADRCADGEAPKCPIIDALFAPAVDRATSVLR